jgi:hypothetical protein
MWWCPTDELFVGPRYGERFDATGAVVGGPAPKGLDRLSAHVAGSAVRIRLDEVIHDTRPRASSTTPRVLRDPDCRRRVVAGGGNEPSVTLPLESIPPGVASGRVGPRKAYFVRVGNKVSVFLADAQHLPGERLEWCASDAFFYGSHGERFDQEGRAFAGPARRDLDRLRVRTRDGLVTVDARRVTKGAANRARGHTIGPLVCGGQVLSA